MKLLAATLASIQASHYRGGSYSITQSGAGLSINRGQTWRRSYSGYSGGCTQSHIDNQIVGMADAEDCWNADNTRCGKTLGGYIVSDIEDTLSTANNYCYGSRQEDFVKPSQPYEIEWDDCCWVKFTTDDNVLVSGGSYGFLAQINDPNNNTPETKLPPIWKIMAGCPAQTIDLNPSDKDGDTIKCRWATSNESLGAWSGNHNFGSITLDENTCILTYDGTNDSAPDGVKPIAVQVEDFDSNGNVKSSMPVQFLATVWTPSNSNFRSGRKDMTPYQYPDLFPVDDDDEDEGRKRRSVNNSRVRRSVPAYCNATPTLENPSPAAGSISSVTMAGTSFTLKASSPNGSITRFTYQSAPGISCGAVDSNGEVQCTFTPTNDQVGSTVTLCFQAEDNIGLQTERRCTSFTVKKALYDIQDTLDALDAGGNRYVNYGCAGIGDMDHTAANAGKPADAMDKLLAARKNCLKCAEDAYGAYEKYQLDVDTGTCLDSAGTGKRSFCECDKEFVLKSKTTTFDSSQLNSKGSCVAASSTSVSGFECCPTNSNSYSKINKDRQECCSSKPEGWSIIGEC